MVLGPQGLLGSDDGAPGLHQGQEGWLGGRQCPEKGLCFTDGRQCKLQWTARTPNVPPGEAALGSGTRGFRHVSTEGVCRFAEASIRPRQQELVAEGLARLATGLTSGGCDPHTASLPPCSAVKDPAGTALPLGSPGPGKTLAYWPLSWGHSC